MFVVIKRSKTSDRELVYIVESYRDENQKIRQRIIRKCGVLSELLEEDPQALEKLKEEARKMTKESTSKEIELTISLSLPNVKGIPSVNYGYLFVESVFNSLKIERFLERRMDDQEQARKLAAALRYYSIREFFSPLVAREDRLPLDPLFRDPEFDDPPTLEFLASLLPLQEDLQRHIYRVASKDDGCEDKVASLDITSYYFDSETGKSPKGESGKTSATTIDSMILVQVGFLFDRYRNPAASVIFPEGEVAAPTLLREIARIKKRYGLKKVVITSDRGFGSNAILGALYGSGNGYVVGIKVKNSTLSLQEEVLNENGYKWNEPGTFKFKTFMSDRIVEGNVIPEKVIAMWTANNAAKMKQRRDKTIVDYLSNPQDFERNTRPEMDKYVRVHDTSYTPFEQDTDHSLFSFDSESYKRDVALDGYYALATTELDVPETVVIKRYHNLHKIGRALAAPDPDVGGAPRALWTYRTVQAYFLVAFVAAVMESKLKRIVGGAYSMEEIKKALGSATCKNIGQDIYGIDVKPEVLLDIEKAFGVSFDRAYATLEMLRRYRKEIASAL